MDPYGLYRHAARLRPGESVVIEPEMVRRAAETNLRSAWDGPVRREDIATLRAQLTAQGLSLTERPVGNYELRRTA